MRPGPADREPRRPSPEGASGSLRHPPACLARGCRILGAAAVAGAGGLHLQLFAAGYGQVAVIGPLFLLDGVLSAIIALLLLILRHPLVALTAMVVELGAIGGLALATTTGLFGFHQTGLGVAGDIVAAFATESFATLVLAAAVLLGVRRPSGGVTGAAPPRVGSAPGAQRRGG